MGILLAVATGSAAAFWRLSSIAPPQLELSTNELNVEMTDDAQLTRAAITLRNVGGKELTILGTNASCGCLKPELDRTTLAAKEATELRLSIMNSAFATSILKVDVRSDDPRSPVRTLTIKLFKRGQTSLSSRQMVFQGTSRSSLPLTRRVFLTVTRDDLFDKIIDLSATADDEQVAVKVIAERERLRYVVEATLGKQAAAGSWRTAIELRDRAGLVAEAIDVEIDIPSSTLLPIPEIVLGLAGNNSDSIELSKFTVPVRYRMPLAGRVVRAEVSSDFAESLDLELRQCADSQDVVEIRRRSLRQEKAAAVHQGFLRLVVGGDDSNQPEVVYVPITDKSQRRAANSGG